MTDLERLHNQIRETLHRIHEEAYEELNIDCDYLGFEVARDLLGLEGVDVVEADTFGWIGVVAPMPARGRYAIIPLSQH